MFVILPADASPQLVDSVCSRAALRGWQPEVSSGAEQTIVALAGHGDRLGLEQDLAGQADLELVPILSGREYWKQRLVRRVVGWLAAGLGLLTALALMLPAFGFLVPPKRPTAGADMSRAALVRELPENSSRIVRFRGRPVLVVRHGPERYFALSAICTHMEDCQLEWDRERSQIVCPCHGCIFDLYGNVAQGPASVPLQRFGIERDGERVFLRGEAP
jgi:nitrite reductase/ring-hydroxylating ferredoxin subunit